jgi:hypothetical protein
VGLLGEGEGGGDSILVLTMEQEMAEVHLIGSAHGQGDDGIGKESARGSVEMACCYGSLLYGR